MATRNCQGRRLDWAICQSEQVADLSDPWCKLLFTWLIPNADNCGRLDGEPYQLAGVVFPLEMEKGTVTVAKIERWLAELHAAGLVIWYRSGRLRYIQLPKFLNHQTLSGNMKPVSDYPAPDEASVRAWEVIEQAVNTTYVPGPDAVCTEAKDKDKDKHSCAAEPHEAVEKVFAHWCGVLGHPQAKLTPDRKAKIAARLREGSTVERLMQAIDGCAGSKYHMGENPNGRRYDSVELIFRNAGKVDEFAEMAERRPGQQRRDPQARERRIERALEQLRGGAPFAAQAMCNEDEWLEVQRLVGGEQAATIEAPV